MSSISASFASSIAFSAVPPMPIPSIPGGHQPAPIVGTVFSTQSTIESLGLSITNLLLFSEPPPFAATITSTLLPGTSWTLITAGVLSPVFLRPNSGGSTIDARSRLSGWLVAAAHALVDGVFQRAGEALPSHVHADFQKHIDDAGVLADRPLAFGAHARVGQNLSDRVFRRCALFAFVRAREMTDVIGRVVVADVLQRTRNAFDSSRPGESGHACSLAAFLHRSSPVDKMDGRHGRLAI